MDQKHWIEFAKVDGRRNLPFLFVAEVRDIMGDISTSAQTKVVEIARQMMYMDRVKGDDSLPMYAEKPPAVTEGTKVKTHLDCIIDLSRVESLLPDCDNCILKIRA